MLVEGIMNELVSTYRQKAAEAHAEGNRPDLVCAFEKATGEYCSARFQDIMTSKGLQPAVKDLQTRCPMGSMKATFALAESVLIATGTISGPIVGLCCDEGTTGTDC